MIITRTPMRLSLLGGGSDIPKFSAFYNGRVIGMAINQYMYITVHNSFDNKFKISYNKVESNEDYTLLENTRAVGCIRKYGGQWGPNGTYYTPIEIHSISDMPSNGSGLGASSAYTVGLISALRKRNRTSPDTKDSIAYNAIQMELDILNLKIGMQDQIFSTFGGMMYIVFRGGEYYINHLDIKKMPISMNDLMLFQVNNRIIPSEVIFNDIDNATSNDVMTAKKLATYAEDGLVLLYNNNIKAFYSLIGASWEVKKQLSKYITNSDVDNAISIAYKHGAIGCKLCGAGSGGFVLAASISEHDKKNIIKNMEENGYKYYPIDIDKDGSKVIYPR